MLGIMACVLLPVAAVGLMVGGRYAFSNVPSMIGTALLVALGLGCFMRKRLPENQRLSRRTGVGLAFCSVLFLTAGVLKTQRADEEEATVKLALAEQEKQVQIKEKQIRDLVEKTVVVECKNQIMQSQGALNILSNVRQGGTHSGNFTEEQAKQMFRRYQDELRTCEESIANRIRSAYGTKP
ncbi:hypothetical protein ACOTDF_15740 [Achromobacter insuavis]|uniref:hypothetical protein n=1 Tax=Achromobacter insuavis TaxID=1287735 RepID=UPI003B9B86EF